MTEKRATFKIEVEDGASNLTPYASLTLVDEFFDRSGLSRKIDETIGARQKRGASDSKQIRSIVMGMLCGGKTVEEQKHMAARLEPLGITIPSITATRAYLEEFHNAEEDSKRGMGKSFIPEENKHLAGFAKIHMYLLKNAYKMSPLKEITLDQDATLIPTGRPEACVNYKKEKSYEAFNTYCQEYGLMVATRYSDGNVNAGFQQLEEFKKVLLDIPEGIETIKLRSDTAGYQINLLKYCAEGLNERFGKIPFGISCPVGSEFKDAVKRIPEEAWRPLLRKGEECHKQEWAEVAYAPGGLFTSKASAEIRFYAIRELCELNLEGKKKVTPGQETLKFEMDQGMLDALGAENENLKALHLTYMSGKTYKVFGVVSNILDQDGDEIILWSRERCGKSEQAHDILKNELGGGHVPSHLFGVNAVWWNIQVLAMNVNSIIKTNLLPKEYASARLPKMRYMFYTLVGKVVRHARRAILKIWTKDVATGLLIHAFERLD